MDDNGLEAVQENVRNAKNEMIRAVLGLERVSGVIFKQTIVEMKQAIGDMAVTEHILELYIEEHSKGEVIKQRGKGHVDRRRT